MIRKGDPLSMEGTDVPVEALDDEQGGRVFVRIGERVTGRVETSRLTPAAAKTWPPQIETK